MQFKHWKLTGAKFSPNGKKVLTWGGDGIARLWNTQNSSRPVGRVTHNSPIISATFSQDGKSIITFSEDGMLEEKSIEPFLTHSKYSSPKYPEIVSLQGGPSSMGSSPRDSDGKPAERPRHNVTITPFAMGRYEVTNNQFIAFLNDNLPREKEFADWFRRESEFNKITKSEERYQVEEDYQNFPVVGVTWYGAEQYCIWLTNKTDIPFRLPTETEWEYACRAGTRFNYSFGNDAGKSQDYGWFNGNSNQRPYETGLKLPNEFGLYDMHGNLWEWCLDGWSPDYNKAGPGGRAVQPTPDNLFIIRGGSVNEPVIEARSANRLNSPIRPLDNRAIGFRVAASVWDGYAESKTAAGKENKPYPKSSAAERDKIQIFGSPLSMYSLLRDDFIISILNDDGSLDMERLNQLVARIADKGANALRDFYWIGSEQAYKSISPFWRKEGNSYIFNERYFEHQRVIAQTCNKYNMRYYLIIFDQNGIKRHMGNFNPWRFFEDFFYGDDAEDMRRQYIDRILTAFEGLDVGLELCNEPKQGSGKFLADTFLYLNQKGFPADRIIIGIDYYLKEKDLKFGKDYVTFRNIVADKLGSRWRRDLKSVCISPFHNAKLENIDALFHLNLPQGQRPNPGGTRRILYSMDGVRNPTRPTREQMKEITRKILDTKSEAREKGKVLIEVVFGKTSNDPLDSLEGVSEAYKEIWGEFPENYHKYRVGGASPQAGTTQSEGENNRSITIISPKGGENWRIGSPYYIAWTSTVTINYVELDFSFDNGKNWNNIKSAIRNSGKYSWMVPKLPFASDFDGCKIKVSGITRSSSKITGISDGNFTISRTLRPGNDSIKKGRIKGVVINATTGKAIAGAEISISNYRIGIISDLNGSFVIENLLPGIHRVMVEKRGYHPHIYESVEIKNNQTTTIKFEIVENR
ncbi:MAG: SUMF1/EgtB/PvdO family nonheme iron enzyme [bacterium]|nr:SUMF1/EgtB/PvdO family nonheme iron enzyme [bacterium]